MNTKTLFLSVILSASASVAWATDYYVSPTGSGSKYTLESPGLLSSTVIGKLQAGETTFICWADSTT